MQDEFSLDDLELDEDERKCLDGLEIDDLRSLSEFGSERRRFLGKLSAAGAALLAAKLARLDNAAAAPHDLDAEIFDPAFPDENAVKVSLSVNGAGKSLSVDARMTLLDALREKLDLTGSKKGCDHGQCGACTVIVDGRRTLSCLTLAASCEGRSVTTIEGLAKGEDLHPMQAAFIKHDGFQCGYCTPGQICSAVALLQEAKNGDASYVTANVRQKNGSMTLSDEEIKERMSGNLCRCGAYPNILAAVKEVHSGKSVGQTWQFVGENSVPLFPSTEGE